MDLTIKTGFVADSPITKEGRKIPYFAIELTAEQIELIKNRKPIIMTIDGRSIFKIKDSDKAMVYVTFMEKE